jgi:hypothetical protein
MAYQFQSAKQRRWFFWSRKYSPRYAPNYYSQQTGWIRIDSLDDLNPTAGMPPQDGKIDKWLAEHGLQTFKEYQQTLEEMPPWIRWLADSKTTLILIDILLGLISLAGMAKAITYVPNHAQLVSEIISNASFRKNIIRGNLVRTVKEVRNLPGSSWRDIEIVIEKFRPYLKDADGLARWAFLKAG